MTGKTLYIIAGPIGNLADITLRSLEKVRQADIVIAEDTRVTSKLLGHYSIRKPMYSAREHSSTLSIENILQGKWLSACYFTDAGTPGVSDPGGKMIERANKLGISVVPLPGPSAMTAIMQIAGISLSDGVLFLGFLPKKKGRQTLFTRIKSQKWPVIIFEDKHRLIRTLNDFVSVWPEAHAIIGREMTKQFEEVISGPIIELSLKDITLKGEFTVLISPQ